MKLSPCPASALALLLVACSGGAATTTPTAGDPAPSASSTPTPTAEVRPAPAACGGTGQELSVRQAGACYLALIDPVNLSVPPLTGVVFVSEPDPVLVRETAGAAVDALATSSATLLDRRWPARVASPVREMGQRQRSMLDAARRLAADTSADQILRDREAWAEARGDYSVTRTLGGAIRAGLNLPPNS